MSNGDGQIPLSVYVLGQADYCPRAGVLAYELVTKNDPEEDVAPLDYRVPYELWDIERQLGQARQAILAWTALAAVLVVAVLIANRLWSPAASWLGMAALVAIAAPLCRQVGRAAELSALLQQAQTAAAVTPPTDLSSEFPVNWWALLAAGFESTRYRDGLRDEDLVLTGRPWRVLRKGNLRIPVLRSTREDEQVYRNHRTRLRAYCHLLQAAEGAESPYGIVIFAGSYEGMAIPARNPAARVAASCDAVRLLIDEVNHGDDPPAPENKKLCSGCPFGKPERYQAGQPGFATRKGPLQPLPSKGVDGRWCHSRCGDRFRWAPPHADAIRTS